MITGLVLLVLGLFCGLWGAIRFNFAHMMGGWIIAGVGFVIFVVSFVRLP